MTRLCAFVLLLTASTASAMDSNFHIAFPLGINQVSSDDVRLPPISTEVPSGIRAGLRLGLNIKGYAAIEFDVDAQGWDVFKEERGGLGFVGGGLRLHPVQIAQHWKPILKDRDWDLSLAYTTGWHLLGQMSGGSGLAYEGSYNQFEFAVEYYVSDLFTVALELPWRIPSYAPHVFTDYEDDIGYCFEEGLSSFDRQIAGSCEGKVAPEAVVFSPAISFNFRIPLRKKAKRRRPVRED